VDILLSDRLSIAQLLSVVNLQVIEYLPPATGSPDHALGARAVEMPPRIAGALHGMRGGSKMSSRPTRRSQRTRSRARSRTRGGQGKRNPSQAARGCGQPPTRTAPARSRPDHASWDHAMTRLRRIILLLAAGLLAVLARVIIDGPTLLGGLAAALIIVLLLGSLHLRRQGNRLRPDPDRTKDRPGPR
jgi:hypothetical protein